jgi:hypothetical protein
MRDICSLNNISYPANIRVGEMAETGVGSDFRLEFHLPSGVCLSSPHTVQLHMSRVHMSTDTSRMSHNPNSTVQATVWLKLPFSTRMTLN